MAEVTYYFNSYSGTPQWTNPGKMVDGDLGTFAYTNVKDGLEQLDANNCPGTDLGTITKVELRGYAYGDGDDKLWLQPFTVAKWLDVGTEAGWTLYGDITNDTGDPTGWTWSGGDLSIVALDCQVRLKVVGKANTMYCAKVEIRVTYTPSAGYYHGLKVQGEGELALCDVGTNPLRIRKGGVTYGIELVATDDPNASRIRIKTPAGIKAIRKYT